MPTDTMILNYVRSRALGLVYTLSGYDASAEAYEELLRIAQQAKDDLDAGQDPGDRVACINRQYIEL